MAIFELEIADSDVDRVFGAICANYGWSAQVPNPDFDPDLEPADPSIPETIANPETPAQFANRMTRKFLIDHTESYEINQAKQAARLGVADPPAITDPSV